MADSLEQIQTLYGIEPINQAFEIFGRTLMNAGFFSTAYIPKEDILKAVKQRIADETDLRGGDSPVVRSLRIFLHRVENLFLAIITSLRPLRKRRLGLTG